MKMDAFRFVHVTDTHIMAGGRWRTADFEFDTESSLRRVVAAVRALDPAPVFAVLGGDLASPDLLDRARVLTPDDYAPSYTLLREILAGLPCPAHFLIGNHDNRAAFNRALRPEAPAPDAPCYYSFDHGSHHFVALDSHEAGRAGGFLGAAQVAWLERDLARHRARPTIAFVHHHPWPLGLAWIDAMMLRNGDELMGALRRSGQVRWVISGHVHLDQVVERDGLTMITSPSTCVQLSKVSQVRKILDGPPAFRVVDVAGDALTTRVLHLHGKTDAEL
jgi:Icc protein